MQFFNYQTICVAGSPFRVPVRELVDPSKVRCSGPGLGSGVRAHVPQTFTVDSSKAGVAPLEVQLYGPTGETPYKRGWSSIDLDLIYCCFRWGRSRAATLSSLCDGLWFFYLLSRNMLNFRLPHKFHKHVSRLVHQPQQLLAQSVEMLNLNVGFSPNKHFIFPDDTVFKDTTHCWISAKSRMLWWLIQKVMSTGLIPQMRLNMTEPSVRMSE